MFNINFWIFLSIYDDYYRSDELTLHIFVFKKYEFQLLVSTKY